MARPASRTTSTPRHARFRRCTSREKKSGFTIVELLIVVVVIAILAAVTIVGYTGISQRAKESAIKSALSSAAKQLGIYSTDNGIYPQDRSVAGVHNPQQSTSQSYSATSTTFCLSYSLDSKVFSITHEGVIKEVPCAGVTSSNVAGTGSGGATNGAGAVAQFTFPYDVTSDASGNLYIADFNNHLVRKITSAGVVSTLAGSGIGGNGDGTGTAAQFDNPAGIAVNSSGVVYVADVYNHRIRRITSAGVVTTFAGGTGGYAEGTGTAAQFNNPRGVAIDSAGSLYVADAFNHRIRKITSAGVVTTFAGSGTSGYQDGNGATARFAYPYGVAVDASGTVYVADTNNHRIRKITSGGVVSTLAGTGMSGYQDGNGATARFDTPYGIAVDESGVVYVADTNNNRIRKIQPSGDVTTLVGANSGYAEGSGTAALFNTPRGITITSAGVLYAADTNNHRIRKIE